MFMYKNIKTTLIIITNIGGFIAVNIGNLSFTHRGDYDGTAYSKNDAVLFNEW